MAKARTQKTTVLDRLKKKKAGLTQVEAYERYGITRLSAVIFNLRDEGYDIKTDMKAVKNRYGDTCYVAYYTLER
jgi:hypothetical protein